MTDSAGAAATGRGAPGSSRGTPTFGERLYVPWWGWPLPLAAAVLLAAEVHMGYPGVRAWLPYLITIPIVLLAMAWLSRVRIELRDGELWVGDAHLPVEYIGEVEVLTGTAKRKALGPELDPQAFVVHRGWVKSALRVELTDPRDPTPYWVFSVRSADRLAELLRRPS
ncbi:DUF3093 domain-containing protein [Gandjariella thermophila]|uniref:DUF3093 domain-containing protein n=1 Tax=Gandjariella thermophila TaxID=1931992 RepID=A0A4D4JD34_9PSEU|nr:DUF3093 domain-containing protein [Gandjariella thermophila]GDY32920.1 hypothetical protein GTS_45530 [Gandjariella thermophila]